MIKLRELSESSLEHNYYYGNDLIPHIGITGFAFKIIKTVGLFGVYLLGYIIKEKVWNIVYPIKTLYEQGELP